MSQTDQVERTYSLSIKGEQHTYAVEAWQALTFAQLCVTLSDLTGYRIAHLRSDLPKRFDRLGYVTVRPAAVGSFDEVPSFHVRSSDGGKPEPAGPLAGR